MSNGASSRFRGPAETVEVERIPKIGIGCLAPAILGSKVRVCLS